mmetsp:Transcript_38270/g.86921  ORF Transcript_38270/g.86921 Transcript_38270/m.86921 type:complete len:339 (+) Transcript_38270:453-1469(+)
MYMRVSVRQSDLCVSAIVIADCVLSCMFLDFQCYSWSFLPNPLLQPHRVHSTGVAFPSGRSCVSMWYPDWEHCTLAMPLPPPLCLPVRLSQLASSLFCCRVTGLSPLYASSCHHTQHPPPIWASPLQYPNHSSPATRRHKVCQLISTPFLDQRFFYKFALLVCLVVIQFLRRPVHMGGNMCRGALQHPKPPPQRRYSRAHMPFHPIACAHCNALQTLPCTPPHAPYFPISSWNLVPMDRNWSIGHNHVEISANFTLLRLRLRLQPKLPCVLFWAVQTSTFFSNTMDLLPATPSISFPLPIRLHPAVPRTRASRSSQHTPHSTSTAASACQAPLTPTLT